MRRVVNVLPILLCSILFSCTSLKKELHEEYQEKLLELIVNSNYTYKILAPEEKNIKIRLIDLTNTLTISDSFVKSKNNNSELILVSIFHRLKINLNTGNYRDIVLFHSNKKGNIYYFSFFCTQFKCNNQNEKLSYVIDMEVEKTGDNLLLINSRCTLGTNLEDSEDFEKHKYK